jgi:hypothetical protein
MSNIKEMNNIKLNVKNYDELKSFYPEHRVLKSKEVLSADEIIEDLKKEISEELEKGKISTVILVDVDNICHRYCIFDLEKVESTRDGLSFEYVFTTTIA